MDGGPRRGTPNDVGRLGRLVAAVGGATVAGGTAALLAVRAQLAAERVVIPTGATHSGGRTVTGPLTAFREASVINATALQATGGRTYGELDEEDPMARMALDAALLRGSLMTSVLAFGVAAAAVLTGLVEIAIGIALDRTGRRLPE